MQALWLVGIHGATIITSLLTPVVLYNMQQNAEGAAFLLLESLTTPLLL